MTIGKKTLEYLAELSRIEISDKGQAISKKEEKLLNDLQNILGHFDELKEINTDGVEPLAGGTVENNVFRNDESFKLQASSFNLIDAFPEKEGSYLRVPPVFE